MVRIVEALLPDEIEAVRRLWIEYWNELGFAPCFQGFGEEVASLPGKYSPPQGILLLLLEGEEPAGTIAFRPHSPKTCEAKRLFVPRAHRGKGFGRLLLDRLIEEAKAHGYERMVGDTLMAMSTALEMYIRTGFRRIEGYEGSTPGHISIELALAEA